MKLKLKNVGKIEKAEIEINGITVIAGENNTGKSTVGKMLYCIFHSFYKIEQQIEDEKRKTIGRVLLNYYNEEYPFNKRFNTEKIVSDIIDNKKIYTSNIGIELLTQRLNEIFVSDNETKYFNNEHLTELAGKIQKFLEFKDEDIADIILKKRLIAEFGMKVGYLNSPGSISSVELDIQEQKIDFEVINNETVNIMNYFSLIKEIIYIDDPFVLDNIDHRSRLAYRFFNVFEHSVDLLTKITDNRQESGFGVIDELFAKKRLERIFDTMNGVCDGDIVSDDNGNYTYKTDKLNDGLDMVNLSTGLKSFVILRTLLKNGRIDDNGVIILDEPEIHLHPEWQLKFAEIIVLIQREFKTNILLNTHSPYFLNAIEVYSEKYGIDEKCKYYMTDNIAGMTYINDVTNEREQIYAKLAKPLQDLENMEYRNGDTI